MTRTIAALALLLSAGMGGLTSGALAGDSRGFDQRFLNEQFGASLDDRKSDWFKVAQVTVLPAPSAEQAPTTSNDDGVFSIAKSAAGDLVLSGTAPVDPTGVPGLLTANVDAVTVTPATTSHFAEDAQLAVRLLGLLQSGTVARQMGVWTVTGTAADQEAQQRAQELIATAVAPQTWRLDITSLAAPNTAAVEPEPQGSGGDAGDISACQASLTEFSARNAILFAPGAARIEAVSLPALDELAGDLAHCSDAVIYVEGYTDADGEADANLALSVARAEAVITQLIQRQVRPERLYAAGYGETNPIASNDTSDGKRLNRRIVISVRDQHY